MRSGTSRRTVLKTAALASAAVITAQIEAGQQIAYGRQSVSQAVDAFMSTAKKAVATKPAG